MRVDPNTPRNLQQPEVGSEASLAVVCSSQETKEATSRKRRVPVIDRRVDVAAVETARLEKGLSKLDLCAKARIDPGALRNLMRHEGQRSGDSVIVGVTQALGLRIKDVVTITPRREEAA
jgi:hypothetical protein